MTNPDAVSRPISPSRLLVAVVLLALFGMIAGTLVGFCMIILLGLSFGQVPSLSGLGAAAVLALVIGGPVGAVLTPLLSLLVLRRVPLGKAIAVTGVAAIVAGVLVARVVAIWEPEAAMLTLMPGAVLGLLGASLWLRLR